jgi:4-amino-4-deoxy-L-arabinose transferase-like glycosyltransferase
MDRAGWWCPPGRWGPWLWLGVLGLLALLPGLATLPIVDRDEPRFAHATIEMMDRGEWIVPYFNDAYRFDKPPLTYWWMRLHYHLFGRNEFAARLHSVLAALACAGVLYAWGRQLIGAAAAWWAAAGWLTCLQVLVHGRIALADMPMILAVFVSQWSLWQILVEGRKERRWWWALWLAQGLGFLAKGPIVFIVPLLAWALFALWGRVGRRWAFRARDWGLGVALALGIVAAWGIPALVATEGAYFDVGIGKHVVERGMGEFNARTWNPLFYLVLFVFLYPWSGALPRALRRAWRDRAGGRFLVAWLAAPIIVFTFYQTQLPHYILPGYGAALLLIFGQLAPAELGRGWFPKALGGLFGVLGLGVLFIAILSRPPAELQGLRWALASLGLTLLALTGLWWAAANQRRVGALAAVLVLAVSLGSLGRNLRACTVSVALGEAIEAPAGTRAVGIAYREGSLVYYTDLFWDFPEKDAWPEIGARMRAGEVDLVVLKKRFWDFEGNKGFSLWHLLWRGDASHARSDESLAARPEPASLPGWTRETLRGLNLGRFTWVEVEIWRSPALATPDTP